MSTLPTHDDANLILRLYELRREERMRKARDWFNTSFKAATAEELGKLCPPGSEANASFRMVLSYWEMAASFVTSGVLNQELFFQSQGELLAVWTKTQAVIPEMRRMFKSPLFARNLETVGNAWIEWMNQNAPGAYDGFKAMVQGSAAQK